MPAVELVAAVGDEHERARVRQAAGDVVEQLARARVGPVDVLDDEQQAALARRQREQTDDGLEEAKLGLSRVADGRVGLVAAEEREELRELPPCRAELVGEPVGVLAREVVADRLDEREVGERELGLAACAPEDLPVEPLRAGRELGREARLAHAGLTAEGDEAALAAVGCEERVLEDEELLLTADQGGAEDAFGHAGSFSCGWSAFGARAGNPHFTDGSMLSLRAWIGFARGDLDGAERDSKLRSRFRARRTCRRR